jgi:hypothetical protein
MKAIAVNTQHTNGKNRGYAESWTSEQLDGLLSEDWLRRMVAEIRAGDEKKKDKLPYICPHYSEFRNNHRAQADIIPEAFTFMTCVDVDDKALVDRAIKRALELNGDEYSDWQDMVLRIEYSARRKVHIYIRIPKGMTIEEAQQAFCKELGIPFDESCITPERFIYVTGKDEEVFRSPHWLEPLSEEEIAERREAYLLRGLDQDGRALKDVKMKKLENVKHTPQSLRDSSPNLGEQLTTPGLSFKGIPYADIIREWWFRNGGEPTEGERNVKLYQLAVNLRAICDNRKEVLMAVMPRLGLDEQEFRSIIDSACKEVPKGISKVMKEILSSLTTKAEDFEPLPLGGDGGGSSLPRMPQGVKDSIDAVGPALAMPVVTAICPCIGALATGVVLDVHGQKKGLNLIAYIAGDFASGKGQIDPVVDAWMSEVAALDAMYLQQEEEFRNKKQAAKNKKEQPEEPKLPVRFITLNTTVAKLADRLANTEGKHAFSFTPEADTVAQKWRSAMSDFSVMLRQSYDGSKYDREAKSVEAVNVHIDHLLWNVTMCGTPDALYRVVSNYTDGFQSRIAVARTPDNTFAKLEDKPYVLTARQTERIQQIAHLLPLMQGEVVLPKLENKGREWVEGIRLETMKNDDRTKARQRFRVCVTAQRMTCCLMLCKVCEMLIQKHGVNGAETRLKQYPKLWKEMLLKAQTPQMLEAYDVIADSLMDNALHFFRDRIENAFSSRDYAGSNERKRMGKNDSIYERLDVQFTYEQAAQHCIAIKGAGVTKNSVQQMLKNWRKQGLAVQTEDGRFRKMQERSH